MEEYKRYFLLACIIILASTPLGYKMIDIVYYNAHLTGTEFVPILHGFIHSFMLIGVLTFSLGVIDVLVNKNNKL